ncbi:MAG: hypothetical protein FIA95_15600 [Gemmatimonadetes bacterium]|nr:hypothetical protein [Gemmatimonadota bacterium]
MAVRSLPRLALASLEAGAHLASAVLSATVWLDPSLLAHVLEARRWRSVGTVRSRPFLAGPFARTWALLQAEWRRQLRRPGALAVWVGLAVAAHAVALAAPSSFGVARILLGYLATGRLMSGLRTLSASPGLQRALGGSGKEQRLAHLVVPAVGAALWWAATAAAATVAAAPAAAVPAPAGALDVLLVAGIVGAAYRASTRPQMSYGGAVVETPLGLFPMELMLQLGRGLDLLGATVVVEVLARG